VAGKHLRSIEQHYLKTNRQTSKDRGSAIYRYSCTFYWKGFCTRWQWKRHEEATHVAPKVWICEQRTYMNLDSVDLLPTCPVCEDEIDAGYREYTHETSCTHGFRACWEKPKHQRTFHQKEKLDQHLAILHAAGGSARRLSFRSHLVDVPTAALVCPFCDRSLGNWDERVRHVAEHFVKYEVLPKLVQLGP
jgi:hypothetical protein